MSKQRQSDAIFRPPTAQELSVDDKSLDELLTGAALGIALRSLRDLPALQSSPLIHLTLVTASLAREGRSNTVSERAQALQQVLLATIQELQPCASSLDYRDAQWFDFVILSDQYARERSPERVLLDINVGLVERKGAEHTISLRTYARRNERARRRLLERLREKERVARLAAPVGLPADGASANPHFSWSCLWQVARQVSICNLTLRTPAGWAVPYIQRQELLLAFRRFLASDAGCFLLTGRSGAGKSSFLRSLLDEYAGDQDMCLIAFDAAQLRVGIDLKEHVAGALCALLGLPDETVSGFWASLAGLSELEHRRVVLVFDEINENPRPAELVREVNDLIGSWPWLKIALASRPEAWWSIWRSTALKGRFFSLLDEMRSVELNEGPPLSAWDLQPFSYEEAREAYKRYQAAYLLETEYDALPRETRELIREPLILWLIAATYDAMPVSPALRRDRLLDDYFRALLMTRRLYPEDWHLLTQELVPRLDLLSASHARQLDAKHLADNPDLCRRIFGPGDETDGTPTDPSLQRLVDARIFISHRHEWPPYIELRHGLVYEHLAGERLYAELLSAAPDRLEACRDLLASIDSSTETWGAVQRAIYLAFRDSPALMASLAFTECEDAAMLVRAALLELAECEPEQARLVIRRITNRCRRGRPWQAHKRVWQAADCALTTAVQLDDEDVFLALLAARDEALSEMAVGAVYSWGKKRPDQALDVTERLGTQITRSSLAIDHSALHAAFYLIPLLAINCWEHEGFRGAKLERLLSICGNIVTSVERHVLIRMLRGLARTRVAASAVSIAYRLLQEGASFGTMDDAASYQSFFKRPVHVRRQAVEALAWVDRSYGSLADAVPLLTDLYSSQDHLSAQIADAIIMGRGVHCPAAVEPVLNALLRDVHDLGDALAAHVCSCWCECAIRQREMDLNALRVMAHLVSQAMAASKRGYGVVVRDEHVHHYRPLHYYIRLWARVHPDEPVDLVAYYLDKATAEQDEQLLRHVIDSFGDALNLSSDCSAMLRPLARYAHVNGPVRDALANSLAAIRGFQPALVDRFLFEAEAPRALREEICRKTRERPRRWHYIGLLSIVQDFIAYAPSSVMQPVLAVMRNALELPTWTQAASAFAQGMLDLLRAD